MMSRASKKLIHRGERTHSHDQAMTPVSLRVMKTMVSKPAKPMPPLLVTYFSDIAPLRVWNGDH